MVFGMATTKITITLEDDQIGEVRALVAAGKTASISAFVKGMSDIYSFIHISMRFYLILLY